MASKEFKIMGKYQGKTEEIDTAEDEQNADYLVGEYRMAFGSDWQVWKKSA